MVVEKSLDTLAKLSPENRNSWPGNMSEPAQLLLEYWVSKCRNGRFPLRSEIEPREIVDILPYIFFMERLEGEKSEYRFQLVGTRIVEAEGECTGKLLSDLFPDRDRYDDIWWQYDHACEGEIHVRHENLGWRSRDFINYEVLLLPLCGRDEKIGYLIGTAHGSPLPPRHAYPKNARLIRQKSDVPGVSVGADGIVTVDYKSDEIAVSPATVRYTRQKFLELGQGKPVPVLILAEAISGVRGGLQAAMTEPNHVGAVLASAIVATTPTGRKMAEAFIDSHRSPFPIRLFGSVKDAKSWLRGFM